MNVLKSFDLQLFEDYVVAVHTAAEIAISKGGVLQTDNEVSDAAATVNLLKEFISNVADGDIGAAAATTGSITLTGPTTAATLLADLKDIGTNTVTVVLTVAEPAELDVGFTATANGVNALC